MSDIPLGELWVSEPTSEDFDRAVRRLIALEQSNDPDKLLAFARMFGSVVGHIRRIDASFDALTEGQRASVHADDEASATELKKLNAFMLGYLIGVEHGIEHAEDAAHTARNGRGEG